MFRLLNLSTPLALLALAPGACGRAATTPARRSPRRIDRRYRTLADRAHTGIGGSSMGGLSAIHAGVTRPEVFSRLIALVIGEGGTHNQNAWASRLAGALQWLFQ